MRRAELDANGVILNVIEVDPANVPDFAAGFLDIGNDGGPGWTWDGQALTPPPDPAPDRTVMQLSPRQIRIGLMSSGIITAAEAVAWSVNRTLPAAIDTLVSGLAEPEQSVARITLADFTIAERLDPMVALLAAVASPPLDDAALDTFFLTYAQV